jgi:hypothetical protein
MTDNADRHIKDNDFLIRIRPQSDETNEWTGEIDVAIITNDDKNMSDDDYYQILHLTKMVACTIPLMETHEDIRDTVHNFVMDYEEDNITEQDIPVDNDRGKVLEVDDNVVTLSFGSKTKGSA